MVSPTLRSLSGIGSAFLVAFACVLGSAGIAAAQERVEVSSPEALLALFEKHDYTPESWQAGVCEIPRLYLMAVGPNWKINSANIEVIQKKRIFFRALAPLVLRANEMILADRKRLLAMVGKGPSNDEDLRWLGEVARYYKVENPSTPDSRAVLTRRVDAVPLSLVLAQGAEESG